MSLSQTKPKEWEEILSKNLWSDINEYAFERIYLPAAQMGNPTEFKTKVDILLKQWAERMLPIHSVQVSWVWVSSVMKFTRGVVATFCF